MLQINTNEEWGEVFMNAIIEKLFCSAIFMITKEIPEMELPITDCYPLTKMRVEATKTVFTCGEYVIKLCSHTNKILINEAVYDILDIEELFNELCHAVLALYLKASKNIEAYIIYKAVLNYQVKYGDR